MSNERMSFDDFCNSKICSECVYARLGSSADCRRAYDFDGGTGSEVIGMEISQINKKLDLLLKHLGVQY